MMSAAQQLAVTVQNAAHEAGTPSARRLRTWAEHALGKRARGELTVRIVDEAESAALNSRYRGERGATNVLSFSMGPAPVAVRNEPQPLGDLVICAAVVRREAREQGKAPAAHWAHMVVHGVLHLKGYDHEAPAAAARMEARERKLLAALGFPNPYSL
jgi:probable rRNA maturation factor